MLESKNEKSKFAPLFYFCVDRGQHEYCHAYKRNKCRLLSGNCTMPRGGHRGYTRRPNRGIPLKPRNSAQRNLSSSNSQYKHDSRKPIPINLKPSGILTEHLDSNIATNTSSDRAHQSKYAASDDAIIPTKLTCPFYLFSSKSDSQTSNEIKILNNKSFFIFGRDKNLSDIILDQGYDSDVVSKEHAVLQFRKNLKTDNVGCYLMDLGSTNGTFLNGIEIPRKRYVELKNGDKFMLGSNEDVTVFTVLEDSETS